MTFATVSLVVTDRHADGPALAAAAAAARHYDAHLDIRCVGVDPARYEPLPAGAAAIVLETGAAEAHAHAETLSHWVEKELDATGLKVSVEIAVVPHLGLEPAIARSVRYSDLIVCTRPYGRPSGPLQVSTVEAALFGTGSPVVVLGNGMTFDTEPKRVMVAWDESNEALATIRKSLPLLKVAEQVDIVLVDPPVHSAERSDPGGAVSLMLARHGVRAEVSILARTLPTVAECLSRFATEHGSDLMVMGAYGHSRFREAVLGGTTRDLLEGAPVPLFMAH